MTEYAQEFPRRVERLRQMIAERIAWSASRGFSTALTSDIFRGGSPPTSNVSVYVEDRDNVTVVIADGSDAVFIEFGAGIYYNTAAGTSPHPWGSQNGFLIGEYGKGHGKQRTWALPGSTRYNPILTHGTPAAMPMYRGLQEALSVIDELAREAFG